MTDKTKRRPGCLEAAFFVSGPLDRRLVRAFHVLDRSLLRSELRSVATIRDVNVDHDRDEQRRRRADRSGHHFFTAGVSALSSMGKAFATIIGDCALAMNRLIIATSSTVRSTGFFAS